MTVTLDLTEELRQAIDEAVVPMCYSLRCGRPEEHQAYWVATLECGGFTYGCEKAKAVWDETLAWADQLHKRADWYCVRHCGAMSPMLSIERV